MVAKKQLGRDQVGAIIALKSAGLSQRKIATQLNISVSTANLWIQRGLTDGFMSTPKPKPRSGRPRKTSSRTDSILKREVQTQPTISCKEIKMKHNILLRNVSVRTIQHRLQKDLGFPSRQAAKKPLLTLKMKKSRVNFCKEHKDWTENDWKKVLFSDESSFCTIRSRAKRVRRPIGSDRMSPKYTVSTVKHPPSVMVWGCFSYKGRGSLYFLPSNTTMNGKTYLQLLKDKLPTTMTIHETAIFQHDGAPCHRAKLVSNWLNNNNFQVLQWPGNSPDLNPIENLWNIIKDKLQHHSTGSLPLLIEAIKKVWCTEISKELCETLVKSQQKRIMMVLKKKGEMTKY